MAGPAISLSTPFFEKWTAILNRSSFVANLYYEDQSVLLLPGADKIDDLF